MDFRDYAPLYDFSLIEKAIQQYFCDASTPPGAVFEKPLDDDDPKRGEWTPEAGSIAFYTAFQALTFTKCRPRVWIDDFSFSNLPDAKAIKNGVLRQKAWTGSIRMGIITAPNMALHVALRTAVLAILPELQPVLTADGSGIAAGGINGLLQFHEVGIFEAVNMNPRITPGDGYYASPVTINLTFGVRENKWPAA